VAVQTKTMRPIGQVLPAAAYATWTGGGLRRSGQAGVTQGPGRAGPHEASGDRAWPGRRVNGRQAEAAPRSAGRAEEDEQR
jgi:hypothetical protein